MWGFIIKHLARSSCGFTARGPEPAPSTGGVILVPKVQQIQPPARYAAAWRSTAVSASMSPVLRTTASAPDRRQRSSSSSLLYPVCTTMTALGERSRKVRDQRQARAVIERQVEPRNRWVECASSAATTAAPDAAVATAFYSGSASNNMVSVMPDPRVTRPITRRNVVRSRLPGRPH